VDIAVSLEDLYNGAARSARIARNVICKKCSGSGAKDGQTRPCAACGGRGHRMVQQQMAPGFVVQMQETCSECAGRGKTAAAKCPHCGGAKVLQEEKTLTAQIEKGMASNAEIRFERESEQQPGVTPGDVIFRLKLQPHGRFRREGDNLHMEMRLSLREALLGYDRTFRHLDGRDVRLAHAGVTQPFETRRVEGEGMPQHDTPSVHGALFVQFIVDLPKTVSEEAKAAVARLFPEVGRS
jgi:DnaJ-class molecular chaperone